MTSDVAKAGIADGRRARGARTREAVLAEAVQLASVEGLEGLSIAHLASRLGTAKSSVHASFGSKEALQVAVIAHTRDVLIELVIAPALKAPDGLRRLSALGAGWMSYLESKTFEGGCVLSSASLEMDGRPGPARDAIAAVMREWLDLLEDNIACGIEKEEIASDTDPSRLAFVLNAVGMAANWQSQLFGSAFSYETGRTGWAQLLEQHAAQA
ncbi:TetR/AcrR family transcriptional regulator [Parvibaculaceae bacterium PLY_AMNH_Bact1]|nr:TetR/AcrR family transcriptional regulator [Parvibaculaceae bacterium PLY_AMNH_Bact1]